jgi:hypothetical protein
MLTDSPFPKNFSLKVKIDINNSVKRLRYLEQIEKEIVLRASDDSNGNSKTIIRFISDEQFYNNENIQVKEIVPNNDNLTKSVTENNTFIIEDFSSNLKESNTKDVQLLIYEKKILDLSKIDNLENGDKNIINFNLDTIVGCDLNFKSEKSASFSENQLPIELVDNNGNKLNAQCDLGKNNITTMKCIINDEIVNDYTLKDIIIYSSSNYVIISGNGNIFKISCKKQKQKKKSLNLMIMIIIVIIIVVLILLISFHKLISICNSKDKNDNEEKKVEKIQTMNDVIISTERKQILKYKK